MAGAVLLTEERHMGKLDGMRAIVTGASRGIGRAAAIALAQAGADVAINYHRSDKRAAEVGEICRQAGVRVEVVQADVSRQADVERLVARTVEVFGGVDLAVSNAAYSDRELFYTADLDGFRRTIDVTMWGPFYLLRAVALRMIEQGKGGSIVVVSSPHAWRPVPGAMAYNMAKAAIDQMARTAATELCQHRIRVNIVHPGWIDTPGERKFFSEEKLQRLGALLPWGRLGQPEEIARGIVFLCDPASDYITASSLLIDGGIQLPVGEMHRLELPESGEAEGS
jgi:glucose 1-dehydrogenase